MQLELKMNKQLALDIRRERSRFPIERVLRRVTSVRTDAGEIAPNSYARRFCFALVFRKRSSQYAIRSRSITIIYTCGLFSPQ